MLKILFACTLILVLYTFYLNVADQGIVTMVTSAGNIVGVGGEALYVEGGATYSRGSFSYENGKYCGMLSPFLLLSILYYFYSSRKTSKYLMFGCSCIYFVSILQTMSRSGIVAMLIGVLVMIYMLLSIILPTIQK